MYEGIKVLNGLNEVNLENLPKQNGELILTGLESLKIYVNNGAKYVPAQLEVLENGSDVKIALEDENANEVILVLKGLNDILLANNNEIPVFEVFEGLAQLVSLTTVEDLDAAAAGGESTASSQTEDFGNGNPPSIGNNLGQSGGNLDGFARVGVADGEQVDQNAQPVVFDVTLGDLEVLGEHELGDKNTITGQFLVEDADAADTGLHEFTVVDGSVVITSSSGVITQEDDEIEIILNADGSYEVSGDFNDLAFGETATITFDYIATDPLGFESLPATFTLNITGTNDQSIVEDIDVNNELVKEQIHTITTDQNETIAYSYFTITEETVITITTDGPTTDPVMYLLYDNGEISIDDIIDFNDDGHTPAGSHSNAIITQTLQAGNYIIAVSDFDLSEEELVSNFNDLSDIATFTGDITLNFNSNKPIELEGDFSKLSKEIFETSDLNNEDTNENGILRDEDANNILRGQLFASDDDDTDTHTFRVQEGSLDINAPISLDDINIDIRLDDNGNWIYEINGNFTNLSEGEKATVAFQYYADDGNIDPNGESNESERATIKLVITGTNDQPVVENIDLGNIDEKSFTNKVFNDINVSSENIENQSFFEDAVFTVSLDSDFSLKKLSKVQDNDLNDSHTFALASDSNIKVNGESETTISSIDVNGNENSFTISRENIFITVNEDGSYSIEGPMYNSLGEGESLKISFDYVAIDSSEGLAESNTSEAKTLSLTILGTNDQPVINDISVDFDNVEHTFTDLEGDNKEVYQNGKLGGKLNFSVSDEDINDGHEFVSFEKVNATIISEIYNEDRSDSPKDVISEDILVKLNADGTFEITNKNFDNLGFGEEVEISFKVQVTDGTSISHEGNLSDSIRTENSEGTLSNNSAVSEEYTVSMTIYGSNDKPTISPISMGIDTLIYENADIDENDTSTPLDGILRNDEEVNSIKGKFVASDDDFNDAHTFEVLSMDNGNETVEVYNNGNNSESQIQIEVSSSNIDSSLIDIQKILLTNNNANGETQDSETNFELIGDFTALGEGEKATVKFLYQANDNQNDTNGESSLSEPQFVEIVVSGTNDQPLVENIVMGAQVFNSSDTPLRIPEFDDEGMMIPSIIEVTGINSIDDLNIHININHTLDKDLDIFIKSPDGTILALSTDNGGYGDNYRNTEFNDSANSTIWSGNAPFSGAFKPEGWIYEENVNGQLESTGVRADLSLFDNETINGSWTLIVRDDNGNNYIIDSGELLSWSLEFNSETIFENSDTNANDSNGDKILRNDEAVNTLTGVLNVSDEDINDTHTFNIANMLSVQENEDIELQNISYNDGLISTTDLNINVQVESSDVNVSNLVISAIRLLDNDGDSSINFELDGDFSALSAGETATVTFAYYAVDSSDNSITPGETNTSEIKTVSITVTGTNDQPLVDEVILGIDTPIYETNDADDRDNYNNEGRNTDRDAGITQNDEFENALRGKLTVNDQDDNDGHIFDIINTDLNGFVSTLAPEVLNDPKYTTHVEYPVWDHDGLDDGVFDRPVSMVIESSDIDASEIDLDKVIIYSNDGDGREVDFKLIGDFTNLAAGEHATVTFTYNAIDDSANHIPGETNLSEPKTVSITVTGTNDEPVIEEVYNNYSNYETTIENAETRAYSNVILAGGTALEAAAAKEAAVTRQVQDGENVTVEIKSSFVGFIDGQDDDLTDTHTLHMTNTTASNTIAVQTDDGEFLASFDARGNSISATDIKDLSIDFRTILDNPDSQNQEYSYLVNGNFSALGKGESIHIEFDYYAKDDSTVGVNGESDESDVKTIHITIEGTNDQAVIMEYVHDVEIQETNQAIELPLIELGQIAYDTEYTKVLNELYDDTPFAYADEADNGRSIYEEAVVAATMAGEIARAAVKVSDEFTVFGDILGEEIYKNDLIIGHDDDINDKHVLGLTDLDTDNSSQEELLIDFSTTNLWFNRTGSDVKAVFTTDSANVSASDIKDVSVIFNTTSDQEGSTVQEYSYQVVGNYNALSTGETATITFAYKPFDNSGESSESYLGETKEITLTITGTNDKPVVTADKVYDAVLENNDNAIADTVTLEDSPEVTTIRYAFDMVDDADNSDTHEFNIETSHAVDVDTENGFVILETPVLYTDNNDINDFIALQIKLPANVDADDIKIKSIKVIGGEFIIEGEFDALAGALDGNPADELQIKFKYFADDQNGFDGEDGSNESSISDSEFITVKVTGTNDKPLITVNPSDTRMLEDSPFIVDTDAQAPGVQGNLTTLGSLRIADVDHGQSYFDTESETLISGTNGINLGGTLSIAANGDWTYSVDNSNPEIQALKYGESIEQVYTVSSLDRSATQTITVSVHGTEDDAIITGDISGGVKEEDTTPDLSTSGSLTIEDRDNFPHEVPNTTDGQNLTLAFINASDGQGQLGGITFTNPIATYPVGSVDWTYSVANNDARVQALGEGKTIVQEFLVTSQDGGTDETITITITGTNDVPTLQAITSPVIVDTEAEDTFANIVGQLVGDDVDTGTVLTYSVAGTDLDLRDGIIEIKGDYGTLVLITSTGGYTYTPDADAINALAPDDAPVTDTFTFVSNDGRVDSLPQDLVIQITPADDTPVIIDEPDFSVIEDGTVFSGSLEASDADTDSIVLTYEVVGATPDGLTVNPNGTYSFDPSVEAYQSLPDGISTTVSFEWKATDGNTYTATDTVTVTIIGTNDGATIVNPENFIIKSEVEQNFLKLDSSGVVIEDASQVLDMSDFVRVDSGIKAIDITGTFGASQNGNHWNDAFKFTLADGEIVDVSLVDPTPGDSSVTLYKVDGSSITLVSQADPALIQADEAGEYIVRVESSSPTISGDYQIRIAINGDDVKEDVILTVSGEMEVLDVDSGENVFQVQTNVQSTDAYGEFSITEMGTWTYNLFNNDQRIQELAEGEELFDTFTVTSFDGTASEDVVIRIEGTNDLPIATVHTDTLIDTEGVDNLFSSVNVVGDDRVADLNDLTETYSIKDGSVSIASVTVDGLATVVAGLTAIKNGENIDFTAGNKFDFLDNGEVAEVTINYMLNDGTQAVPSTHVITINGTNDLPVITSSATFNINEHDALDHINHDATESNEYDLSMTQPENIANNALVGQVIATDSELDNLEFVITKVNNLSPQDLGFNQIFHINSDGKIFLVQNVDAEVEDTYTIDVRVSGYNTDGSINYTTQQITVNVADLNDNAPVLTITDQVPSLDENNMDETNASPVLLGNFVVADLDITEPTGIEDVTNFTVTGDNASLVEVVDNLDGTFSLYLKTGVNLNHEVDDLLDVTVVYNDGLYDSAPLDIEIAINDINESPIAEDDVLVSGTVLVSEDFESAANGWSNNSTDSSSGDLGNFLGRFDNSNGLNATSKLYDFGIANAGKTVTIAFDLYEIDSWDGEAFIVYIDGSPYDSKNMKVDSHYGDTDGGTSTAGNEFAGWGSEEIHSFSFDVPLNTEGKVELGFGSSLDQHKGDESFGIDNVTITAAEDLALVTKENTTIIVDVLANDFDVDAGDTISINSFDSNPVAGGEVIENGTSLEFKPGSDFDYLKEGEVKVVTFEYDVKDSFGLISDKATVTISVVGTNDAPVLSVFAPANLVANGSFENFINPTTTGWGARVDGFDSWTATTSDSQLDAVAEGHGVAETHGDTMVDMDGSNANVSLSQNIADLNAGETYLLSFDIAQRNVGTTSELEVYWNGILVDTFTPNGTTMQTISVEVVGTAGTNSITFTEVGYPDSSGTYLDNVVLQSSVLSVDENSVEGTVVGQAVSTDPDGGIAVYSIVDDATLPFTIDSATGEITVDGPIDYEALGTSKTIDIEVKVIDGNGGEDFQMVSINVNDIETNYTSTITSPVPLQDFNNSNNHNWTFNTVESPYGIDKLLGWFQGPNATASQQFDLSSNAGLKAKMLIGLKIWNWDGDDAFEVTLFDSNGDNIKVSDMNKNIINEDSALYNEDGYHSTDVSTDFVDINIDFVVPSDGIVTVHFNAPTVEAGNYWSIDNFQILGDTYQELTLDPTNDGEIDMASLLSQANDFNGGTPDSLDVINLDNGDHILSNINIAEVINMTDSDNTLNIKGDDSNDVVNLDSNQWKQGSTSNEYINKTNDVDLDGDGPLASTSVTEGTVTLLIEDADVNLI